MRAFPKVFANLKRSQAAMEFLLTYGWAIMVVVLAIASLAYFGITPSGMAAKYIPDLCEMPMEIYCADQQLYYEDCGGGIICNTLDLRLKNNKGYRIRISNVDVIESSDDSLENPEDNFLSDQSKVFKVGFIYPQYVPPPPPPPIIEIGQPYDLNLIITYKNLDTDLEYTAKGRIRGKAVLAR